MSARSSLVPGRGQIELDVEVDLEGLRLGLLVGEHADDARDAEAAQLDQVCRGHGLLRDGGGEGDEVAPQGAQLAESSCSTSDVAWGAIGTTSAHRR